MSKYLIEAAPDLLEACQKLAHVVAHELLTDTAEAQEALRLAYIAIGKATRVEP